MAKKDEVEILILENRDWEMRNIIPSFPKEKIMKFKKEELAESFSDFFDDITDILSKLKNKNDSIELDQITTSVQISANGGVHLIGMASVGLANTITLTFKLKKES